MEFSFEMHHIPQSFEKLANMQYDLFCKSNLVVRTILSFIFLLIGVNNLKSWWGILLAVYGAYLLNTRYASANHTAHKLTAQLEAAKVPFPASRFCFYDDRMDILPLPEGAGEVTSLAYSEFFRLSEDFDYIYIFRDKFGGYMIPKESLKEEEGQFRRFLQEKTGQTIYRKTTPAMRVFKEFKLFASRKNEPPHL